MEATTPVRESWLRGWARAVFAQPTARIGVGIVALFVLAALAQPILFATVWPRHVYDPRAGFDLATTHPAPISWAHPLGTDAFGKDGLSMLLAGTGPSLVAGATAAVASALVALFLASVVASYRRVGRVLNVLIDGALFVPSRW